MAKILLIDDDQNITDIFQTALEKAGYEVVTAQDGKTGLEKSTSENPDLILLDQVLPDTKGIEVLKTLKSSSPIPVAILSNFGQQELVSEALTLGAADYILKYQIAPEDLIKKVKELLG
ncbi:response regulator [Candidatus Microgenomates bacterium]|nr:response regulator [Candidatus Microgenomates bacterium]MBI2622419.1 response regulator [Candidatus Microgenomates bacterium]